MKEQIYQDNATLKVKEVFPQENVNKLINLFMEDASINMGSGYDDKTLDRVIEIIKYEFSFLPVCMIASSFKLGSLGRYGAGRLVPRTIYEWLKETTAEFNRKEIHNNIPEFCEIDTKFLHKSPLGSAIIKKIDWFKSGTFDINDWDKVPLKELASKIHNNQECGPDVFGLKMIEINY